MILEKAPRIEGFEIIKGFCQGLRPMERITVSRWSNKHRILAAVSSARPGPYRIEQTPYLKDIADDLSETSFINEVVFMKGAQIGATEVGNNWIGYVIDVAPAPMLMIMPSDETVKRNSKLRLDPMINNSPRLKERVRPAKKSRSTDNLKEKYFPLGVLILGSAESSSTLRSIPVKNVMFDEIDEYVKNLNSQGSPIDLGIERTNTYSERRKIYYLSTPTVDGLSAIQKEYENSDKRRYFVPCPHCAGIQTMEWENIKWEPGKTETAYLDCIHCHERIEERHKFKIVTDGQWIATNPEHTNKRRHGYHLSALYSTLGYTWANVVDKYIKAKGDDNKMRAWYNTNLGLCWKENIEVPDWTTLYSRREWYQFNQPPADAAFLTAGVDVQKDRIEVEIVAWCKNKVSYSIDYRVINGDITDQETKDKLGALLNETWERADGALMKLHLMAIDTGYNTNEVYTFCSAHPATRVVPVKGREELSTIYGIPRSIEVARNGKAIGKVKVWGVGVSVIKNELYGWLRALKKDQKEEPLGYCHFPQYDEYYFKMITAEQLQLTQDKRGFKRYMWVLPSHARNEALDCRVYARAAAAIAGMDRMRDEDWDAWATQYPNKEDVPPPQQPPKRGGGFLGDHSGFLG